MKRLLFICLGLMITFSYAQDGSPDLSFGDNGVVTYVLEGEDHWINGVDEKSNGQILALIKTLDFQTGDLDRVFAFNEDGSMDEDFGDNGILDISNPDINFNGLRVLPDNSYFLTGYSNSVLTILKYDEEGTLDTSFGDNGVLQPFDNGVVGSSMIINEDQTLFFLGNKIINDEPHLHFYKFLENGIPDTTYGDNGLVLHSLGAVSNVSTSFRKVDEFFYLGINFSENNETTKNIFRFLINGEIDNTFGVNGRILIPIEEEYYVSFNVFNDGNILVGGSYWDWLSETLIRKTIKINSQGQQIQNFGNGGAIYGRSGVHIQGNQRFIADGSFVDFEGGVSLNYSRFFPNGTHDNSFQFSSNYYELGGFAMKHLQSGKILIVGSDIWYNGPDIKIILQRFNNNPLNVSDIVKNKVAIYPNPSSGVFQLQNNFPFNNNSYDIYDSLGKKIQSGFLLENFPSIDLSEFSSGVYFLKINDIPKTFKLLKR